MTRLLPVLVLVLVSCAVPPSATDTPETTVVTLDSITAPASAPVAAAVRVTTTTLEPPPTVAVAPPPVPALPDPCTFEQYVNELPYRWQDKGPTTEAYRIVAACLGWSWATMDFYQPGVIDDILPGESGQCPYQQRGQLVRDDCTPYGSIDGDDTGFFQITSAAHGRNGVLCKDYGYCGSASIKQSAWHSMRSGLILIMRSGKFPWTWDARACAYHRLVCNTWPTAWVNL